MIATLVSYFQIHAAATSRVLRPKREADEASQPHTWVRNIRDGQSHLYLRIARKFLYTPGGFERHAFQGMATLALQIRMKEPDPAPANDDRQRGVLLEARGLRRPELQERFVTENLRRIFLQIYRMVGNVHDAQDLTQEAFIKALQRQEQLKDELKAAHWLSRIATNTALDFLRRHGRVAFCEMTEAPESHTRDAGSRGAARRTAGVAGSRAGKG